MKTNELDKQLKEWAARNRPAEAALAELEAKIRGALAAEPPPKFRREATIFRGTAPRWLASVALGTVAMLVPCAAFAVVLARTTGLHWATMILGTSPGGIAEMAITAKVLQLGVPVVTAFQVCRLVAVLLIVLIA